MLCERLELVIHVCQAVQHAHQKGIIHRDIKPSNVLVTSQDDKPVVKVIDFGIAKALGQQLTDKTVFTGFAQMIGTPLYMSPEQAALSNVDVDTRSDIYSLGVLLYELLTGSTPLDKKRLKEAAFIELLRVIREEEPPKPSTRLSESKESLPSVSAQRQTEPTKLTRLVRGELDWIVMKALEKDRNRRYETANGFAQDIQRYLADEPVQACPPSAWYRFRKMARRNKGAMAVAAALTAALIFSTVILAVSNMRITESNKQKDSALELAKNEQKAAERNLREAMKAVDQMLTRVGDERLASVPQMEPVRRQLLQDAVDFYQRFLEANPAANRDCLVRCVHRLSLQGSRGRRLRVVGLVLRGFAEQPAEFGIRGRKLRFRFWGGFAVVLLLGDQHHQCIVAALAGGTLGRVADVFGEQMADSGFFVAGEHSRFLRRRARVKALPFAVGYRSSSTMDSRAGC